MHPKNKYQRRIISDKKNTWRRKHSPIRIKAIQLKEEEAKQELSYADLRARAQP